MSDQPEVMGQESQPALPPQQQVDRRTKFRIHLIVKDDSGPIQSKPGGTTFTMGTDAKYRVACDPSIILGHYDRGTTLPWGVRCENCRKTPEFDRLGGNLPKPGQEHQALESEP